MGNEGKRVFLSAGWHNLLLFNYSVLPKKLEPYLPQGAELDLIDGSAHLSLVAFQFLKTRVCGVRWPGFTNFPEVNLRFYVRHRGERGVCFVREYVPSRLVASLARLTYNEPYKRAAMKAEIEENTSDISARYHLCDGQHEMELWAKGANQPFMAEENSIEHFFKEHELGVGHDRRGRLQTYRVHHPRWETYPVREFGIRLHAKELYGEDFSFLQTAKPDSVVFAKGSEIQVFYKDA